MEFIPLYFRDRLTVINPRGTVGVATLWSKVDYVVERFRQAGADLNPQSSPIAVFGNLYGNGLGRCCAICFTTRRLRRW